MVEASFLLFSLNEYLSRTALLVQPLHLPPDSDEKDLCFVDIPLPLPPTQQTLIGGIDASRWPALRTCSSSIKTGILRCTSSNTGRAPFWQMPCTCV